MKIGIIGAGNVGATLGRALAKTGHVVVYGVRDAESPKLEALRQEGATLISAREAVARSEAVLLATPWGATESALRELGDLGGRPLLDATNPIGPGLTLTHGQEDSGGEQVARWATNARVVKVFNTTGSENMARPSYGAARAAIFVCGDDDEACALALGLARDIGFDALRVGPLAKARVLEPVGLLWIKLALVLGHGREVALGVLRRDDPDPTKSDDAADRETIPRSIAILGSGHIGAGLARAWTARGHSVVFGARQPDRSELVQLAGSMGARVANVADAARDAEVVVLAVPFGALDEVLAQAGELEDKVVVDCTNAVAPGMRLALGHVTSAAEELQRKRPRARVFKSFNAQGAENLARPVYGGVRATNFVCGDDADGKRVLAGLVEDVGFRAVDAGPLESSRLVEPLMLLWVAIAQTLGTRDTAFSWLRR